MTRPGPVRPRYDRVVVLVLAAGVTVFALLCGLGVLGSGLVPGPTFTNASQQNALDTALGAPGAAGPGPHAAGPTRAGLAAHIVLAADVSSSQVSRRAGVTALPGGSDVALPAQSGSGRRVVFDMSAQRVWLVGADDAVERSYLVSGSLTDNLHPGSYRVYSRSRWAVGVSDSGVMQYFVRFTRGDNAAIGFHSIPTKNDQPLQRIDQLGTPQSHGCIRQALGDAIALWDFAPDDTPVDVVA